MERYAVIMAGGVGERFWPLSRASRPKHLWNVAGGDGCLLEQTIRRVSKVVCRENILIITNSRQAGVISEICANLDASQIISEPVGRDTSAAIGLAAAIIMARSNGVDSSFAVFPSDHVIGDEEAFARTINTAFRIAEAGDNLITVGISPYHPATGYGYIKRGAQLEISGEKYFAVERFFEKPNSNKAREYVESGNFYWNAGMFVWRTDSIFSALQKNLPKSAEAFGRIRARLSAGESLDEILAAEYSPLEKISIDYAVMEKAGNAYVVPANFDWDDVGSWSAAGRHMQKDSCGNAAGGEAYFNGAKNCVLFDAAGRATAFVGVENLIVVHTPDATLVCSKDKAEDVKALVRSLPEKYK